MSNSKQVQRSVEPLAYTMQQFCAAIGYDRKRVYNAIATGKLRTFKDGRRRMISADAAREFIALRERETAEAEGR
jgi:hypothetical protein